MEEYCFGDVGYIGGIDMGMYVETQVLGDVGKETGVVILVVEVEGQIGTLNQDDV